MMPDQVSFVEMVSEQQRTAILAEVAGHHTLEDVVRFALSRDPSGREAIEVYKQDEYTHDVVVCFAEGVYLVYDST